MGRDHLQIGGALRNVRRILSYRGSSSIGNEDRYSGGDLYSLPALPIHLSGRGIGLRPFQDFSDASSD